VSLPPTLTTRSRLRSSDVCSIGTSGRRDPVMVEAVEVGQAPVREGLEAGGQRGGRRAVGGEAGRGQDAVTTRAPTPRRCPAVARPASGRRKGCRAPGRAAQGALGRGEQVAGIDHRAAERLEDLRLLAQPRSSRVGSARTPA
jgi:hypothetical protein